MSVYTLTIVDTAGIQGYIFGSNALAHNVGASELVRRATHDWVYETLLRPDLDLKPTNLIEERIGVLSSGDVVDIKNGRTIERDNLTSELVYAGGGNAVVLFASHGKALAFARALSRKVLLCAPGLQLVAAHTDFSWSERPLRQVVKETLEKLAQKKLDRARSAPLLGLGVTAACHYTGLPAVYDEPDTKINPDGRRLSAEAKAKAEAVDDGNARLAKLIPLGTEYKYPHQVDHLGRSPGESSYVAIVHTDGNGMGDRVQRIADQYPLSAGNRPYVEAMYAFSQSIEKAAKEALQAMVKKLIKAIEKDEKNGRYIGGIVPLYQNCELPFRPIIYGGDDTTFICDGRLALSLTECYLSELTSSERPLSDGRPISARAGIAVVKAHYPFSQAYHLAEELAQSAKKHIVCCRDNFLEDRNKYEEGQGISALDWHFAVTGLIRDLAELRKREYMVKSGNLLMRPVRLGQAPSCDWRTWSVLRAMLDEFREEEKWRGRRNKLKALRTALRDGPGAVEQFLTLSGAELPTVRAEEPRMAETGWVDEDDRRCAYFDAIEALDLFVPLDVDKKKGGS